MFGALGDIAHLVKAAKDLQGNVARLQEELAASRHHGDAGGGMVRVVVDGRLSLVDVKIEPQAAQDVELLEDLIKAAHDDARRKLEDKQNEEMKGLSGGLGILPGFKMPF